MTESGAQLFARLEARRCLKDIENKLFPGDGGPEPGKTELLYHLLSRCLLPLSAGGLEVDVVFMDTDYSLDMLRLVSILDSRLNAGTHQQRRSIQVSARSSSSSGSDEELLGSCLSRLLVVHCSSSSQLLLTLHFLETTLTSRPRVALLLIDSISAFYWPDRCEGGTSVTKQEEKLSKCAELLGRLLRDYRITVFATCHAIRRNYSGPSSFSSSSSSSSSDIDRPYLCRPWQRLVTHRLLCSRQETTNMAANNNSEPKRLQMFTVHCTSSSSSSSSSSSKTKSYRSSSFCITDAGVEFI
ncbi:DNA repair protein XRCC2 isoform X3 [Gymnodraco acuticeps]|uniref:DNA repair protein XRCC2 isoform X3 n=1 Tax=Gymnodraco acuticeps TaxID=8218 RepID=A0A6P8V8Y0_GYMAC|nr:DNA repair protein XRCC2 isoform X3 [Gymnodraco acuticeps]